MIGKFQQKYQFWDGFGKGFGRVWEGLEGIKIRWKKSFKKGGIRHRLLIAALGHNVYRGGLLGLLGRSWLSLGCSVELHGCISVPRTVPGLDFKGFGGGPD